MVKIGIRQHLFILHATHCPDGPKIYFELDTLQIGTDSTRLPWQMVPEPFKTIFNGQNRNRMPFISFTCYTLSEWPQISFESDTLRAGTYSSQLPCQIVPEPF